MAWVYLCLVFSLRGILTLRMINGRDILWDRESSNTEKNGSYVSALYVMGDSSVDCGENSLFYPIFHPKLSLLTCNGSDSILLPNLLGFPNGSPANSCGHYMAAEKIGLPNSQPFYARYGSVDKAIQVGLNYGSAEATIMNLDRQIHQSLDQQLRQALETFQLLRLQLKEEDARNFLRSSIFYLSFGKNDYINLFLGNSSGVQFKYTGRQFANILVNQMARAIRTLYDSNVRKIICMGIIPLGCAPRVAWEWQNLTVLRDGNGCIEEINDLVLDYNSMLEEIIVELNMVLPKAHITFCDVHQGMMQVISTPGYFGFEDTKNACCGLGLYGAAVGCLSVEMACNQSSSHVWWDLYNPTEALNSYLAESAWSGFTLPSICRPLMVEELVNYN